MSVYSERIQKLLKSATTTKITERRKCVVELLELYENEEAVNEIHRSTEQNVKGVVNWSYIVHTVHKLLINETSRFATKEKSNKATLTERQNICMLVRKTIQHANCYKIPLIKCKDIMPLILQVLGTKTYEYYHETYTGILVTYILPFKIYQAKMLPEQWQELLKICIHLYENVSSLTNKRTILDALQMIVYFGCIHSNLLLHLKRILLFLENVFLDVKTNQEILAESAYKLTNTVCQQIATEYRIMLCQFSENILPNIISLKSSSEKYKLLLLFIKIHHPKGRCKVCDGAYADNWEKWHTILKSIYLMILKDLKVDVLSKNFIYLASEVFKQMLENPNIIIEKTSYNECDYTQSAKRRRIAIKIDGLVNLVMDNNAQEAWPMIQILIVLLKQYPECLKSEDLTAFLKILVDFLTQSCKEEVIMDNLYELAAVLLVNEKMFSVIDMENSNIYWDKIWDILLRSLNVNQNETSTHKLTQLFIINNKITNPNALLKLYLTNVIKWSIMSIRTLAILCEYLSLPTDITMVNINMCSPTMNSNSVRLCLLKWALDIPWHKIAIQIVIDELCLLLINIAVKSRHEKHIKFDEQSINNSCDCLKKEKYIEPSYEDIEYCYLLLTYNRDLLIEKEKKTVQQNTKVNEHILYVPSIVTSLMNSLCDIIDESNGGDDLYIMIIKVAVIAKIISTMMQWNIIPMNINEVHLVDAMKQYLDRIYTLLADIDPLRSKYIYLRNVTKALNILYETTYNINVTNIIVSSATPDMLKNIFSLMNIEDNEIADYEATKDYYNDYGFFQGRRKSLDTEVLHRKRCNFCDKGTIRIQATRALASFCCMNLRQEKCEIQIKLLNNLLKIEMYDLSRTVDFRMAVIVLESLSKRDKEELWKNHKEIPLKNLVTLYHECCLDETAIHYILKILPYFLKYATDYNCYLEELMNIISHLNNLRSKKDCGFHVHIAFTKCLLKIIRINPFLFHYVLHSTSDQLMPIFDSVLSSLASPLFVIKLQAIKCIQEVYFLTNIAFKWKEKLFMQIEELVNKLIISNEKVDNNRNTDEREIKFASSLLVLSAIISSNGTFQCYALWTMLCFVIDQKIEVQIIPRALKIITNQICYTSLIEDNLSYLATRWFHSKYLLQPFPWNLVQCESEEEFYKMYINMFAFIKLKNFELSSITPLCNYVNLPFEQIIENIFPQMLLWLLYSINENNESSAKKLANKMFHKLISNQDEFVQIKKFSNLFNDKFEETLTCLIERLHDEDYLEQMLEVRTSFPISDPPHFKREVIETCLEYMRQHFFAEERSVQYVLACNCPDILQKILLHLVSNIYKKRFVEHKVKAFHQYMFFCTLIVEELNEDYFNKLSMYLIKDISYSLLHIIKVHDDVLLHIACKYFYKFLKQVLPLRSKEIKEILSFAVITLISIAQAEKMPITLDILSFLLIEQKEILCGAIEKLNSFPNVPIFREIRNVHNSLKYKREKTYSLEEEVQHFLKSLVDKNVNYSIEDISHLRLQLSTRKEELQKLYNKLETMRGFAEDCASSMLHQLIYKLIKLTASSDVDVSLEASKCLGELGPNDLTSMILYLEKSHVKETSDLIEILSYKIVSKLLQFIFQSDIELRKVSANALYVILSSPWGQKVLSKQYMEHLKTILGETQVTISLHYIQPFKVGKSSKVRKVGINNEKINNILNPHNTIWSVESDGSYSNWIVEITCKIAECLTGFYSENLFPICALSTNFCEIILPRIIFLIIDIDKKYMSSVCSCINAFFNYHFNYMMEPNTSSSVMRKNCDHQIMHCMLNIVNYIRIQVTDNVHLKLNYMYIAKAAQYCSAFFTAILYAEMFCENILNDYNNFTNVSKIDRIYELSPEEGKVIQNILRDTYSKIGDFDAIHGTGSSHLQDHSTRIQHYVQTHDWKKVMLAQDVELSFGNMTVIKEMANGLHQSGLQYLLGNFISTISKSAENIDEDIQYECAWRLSNWNLCEMNQLYPQNDYKLKSNITECDYHFYHYQALKYFHEGNDIGVQSAIENARMSIIKALRNISLESSKTIYERLMQLQLIREIEELSFAKPDEYEAVLEKWQQQDITNFNEFQYLEPILTQRTIMFQINDTLTDNVKLKHALFNTYLEISKVAADKENLHIATRSLAVLAKQKDLPSKIQDQLLYQESLLARLRKDLEIGRFLLRNLMHKETLDKNLRAQVLRVYGDWMAETKSENPEAVIKKYYLTSIDASFSINEQTTNSLKNLHDTQVALARFADTQFEQICSYMKSPQFESLRECITYSGRGISMDSVPKDEDVRKALILNQRQNINDVAELERIQKEKHKYLILALRYYLAVLQQSEDYNLLVFRVVALWLDNVQTKEVNDLLHVNLVKIPSFKFIPLAPQLAAHMNDVFDDFSKGIYKIMERCALEHPHHTLPVLLALKNLHGDYEYSTTKKKKTAEPRVLGAKKLLHELMQSNIELILREMDKLSHSLVMLANHTTSSNKSGSKINIPKNQEILKVKNFVNVLVPTLTINLKPSRNYNDIIGISKYVETYETVGGVNTPKKLICIGTDGIARYQLVKGKDDLRQDAVMQQVFNVMNILLKAYKETKRRKLMIRTYKVVPLTQRSGILEWCENTIPIALLLTGSKNIPGLHEKYYPEDYSATDCRQKLANVSKSSTDVKLEVFMNCCAHMHPVMHYFFTEKYPSPETWFERRLAYTRSIATTSMAGYILGLGDRHLSNILMDQTTAEVIHIDFGIAFEQGKVLPVPETIPFRLTQNIEVAMGVSGIEGTMRHCCEKTLTVLRDQRQVIITLLQVLLYDPLFTWTVTPAKAYNMQSGHSSRSVEINQCSTITNKTAERALLRIEQKLQGTEEGLASSVSGQVERLIQQARDPVNLCRLYYGWQPYL
ncbi:serine-protein kinase ATM isoform X1 [Hylaeus volcanicus]|uniref:serine-protein kinase ATM isoform X1 n=2 Tax=Hylaeus volcanicus TaxID=313075 RepID=UPI0023B79E84|nr:serine-protein kinase ATM isoform X1 [Hylaeus volcanicus]